MPGVGIGMSASLIPTSLGKRNALLDYLKSELTGQIGSFILLAGHNNKIAIDGSGAAASDGDAVGYIPDLTGNDFNFASLADSNRGILNISGKVSSIAFDGVNTGFRNSSLPFASLSDYVLLTRLRTSDPSVVFWDGALANQYSCVWDDASSSTSLNSNAGTPSYHLNTVAFAGTTRNDLHDAVATGGWETLEIRGTNISAWTLLRLGTYASFEFSGSIAGVIGAPRAILTGDVLDAAYDLFAEIAP